MNTQINTKQSREYKLLSKCAPLGLFSLLLGTIALGYFLGQGQSTLSDQESDDQHAQHSDSAPQEYTCSMHPSVRLSDPDSKCPICFMDLIPVMGSGEEGELNQLIISESAAIMSRVETMKVVRFFPQSETRMYGKIVHDETSISRLTAHFPGRVDRLFVNYIGIPVNKGDHLAEMYSPDLVEAFEELDQATRAYENTNESNTFLRSTALETMQASKEKLRLFGITQEQIEQIRSGSFDPESMTIFSPISGTVTKLEVREGDYLGTGDPIATVSNLSRLWLNIEAYESQLTKIRWGLPVEFTVQAYPGEVFEGQVSYIDPIVDDDTRTTSIRVAVDNHSKKLKPGMFASALVRSKLTSSGAVLSDELKGMWVSPMHPTIVKDHPGSCDICGMNLVSAESLGVVGNPSDSETPIVIPKSSVLFTGVRSIVYVKMKNTDQPTYEGRVVELGSRAGDHYIVQSGLIEGDEVVVNGAFRIDSEMQILAKPSMMNPIVDNTGHQPDNHSDKISSLYPTIFIEGLGDVVKVYLDIQERLAADDFDGYLETIDLMNSTVLSVQTPGLLGDQLSVWRKAMNDLRIDSEMKSMDQARSKFEDMSEGIRSLQSAFGNPLEENIYTGYCPMAFDFKGASWIQRGTTINNPYFGIQMLRCGDIQQTHEPIDQSGSTSHREHQDD